jgi:hypothetical protein
VRERHRDCSFRLGRPFHLEIGLYSFSPWHSFRSSDCLVAIIRRSDAECQEWKTLLAAPRWLPEIAAAP